MNEKLKELLEYLCENVDLDHLNNVEDLHHRALNYGSVARLPLVFAYPTPEEKNSSHIRTVKFSMIQKKCFIIN